MKTNKDLIKTYLQQEKTHGQINSLFFEYSNIYSYGYHYILGKFLDDDLLIINDTGYSATTSKHIQLLRWTAHEINITNFNTSNVDLISVYNELKYLESKLHKARKPQIWYNRINSLYNKWHNFTKKYGALLMIGREIKLSKIAQQSQRVKDIQKIMLRVEQYYTTLTLNLSV
tara:strand:+ start:219 stop:737 length:519 start_codon:yes stop_codon:yes gene_type:complete